MLLQDSRREARFGRDGGLVLLEDQDRSLWSRSRIEKGLRVLDRALSRRRAGPYQLQDAIEGLEGYHLIHSARADLLRRIGRRAEAASAYRAALALEMNAADRAFLERRLAEVSPERRE